MVVLSDHGNSFCLVNSIFFSTPLIMWGHSKAKAVGISVLVLWDKSLCAAPDAMVSTGSFLYSKRASQGSLQGAKKIVFTACHSGKLKLAFTSPDVISTSPKNVLTNRIDFTVLLLFEFFKKVICPSGKLKTEFTSPIAKSTSPVLSDTTFFAHCSSISKCFLEWLLVTLTAFSGFAIRTCGGAEMMWHAWIPTLRWTFWTHH